MSGWIKLHRNITQWEWYKDINTRAVFIHFLINANYKDKEWRGILIRRGQFVRSLKNLAAEIGISQDKIRTAIKHLELSGDITKTRIGKHVVYTIVNYDRYQGDTTILPDQSLDDTTMYPTNKEYKNDLKKGKNTPHHSKCGVGTQSKNQFLNYHQSTSPEEIGELADFFLNETNS